MNLKKLISGLSVAAIALSMFAASTSAVTAGAEAVDFEDGDMTGIAMAPDTEDASKLSVVDFKGSKRLKVDVQDSNKIPKVRFDVSSMVGDKIGEVKSIEMTLVVEAFGEDENGIVCPSFIGGCLGTAADNDKPGWSQSDFEAGEYANPVSEEIVIKKKFLLPASQFKADTTGAHLLLMRWATAVDYDMYIDNIKFLDAKGNAIPLAGASAPAEEKKEDVAAPAPDAAPAEDTTAAPAETTAAPAADAPAETAETTAAPAADAPAATDAPAAEATPAPATGNPVTAGIIAGVMLAAAGTAFASRKRK